MNLQELLEVQVGHLRLVVHAQELGECGVGENATLEGGVEAAVGLDVLGDELGHLRLGTLGTRGNAHERSQLGCDGLLLEEGIVRTTSLPGHTLLGRERRRVDLPLLLGVARLLLRRLCRLLGRPHGITNTAGELRGKSLELLCEGGEHRIARLDGCRGDRYDGHDNLCRGGRCLLGLGCLGHRGGYNDGDGDDRLGGLLGGDLLLGGHLVCLSGRDGGGHF